jgi:hypothetical protein
VELPDFFCQGGGVEDLQPPAARKQVSLEVGRQKLAELKQ